MGAGAPGKGLLRLEYLQQKQLENGCFRQEELTYADCDCRERVRVATLLSKAAVFAGYDYDARGLTHQRLYEMREVFLLSRMALHIHDCPRAGDVLGITTWENGVKAIARMYQEGSMCSGYMKWQIRRETSASP